MQRACASAAPRARAAHLSARASAALRGAAPVARRAGGRRAAPRARGAVRVAAVFERYTERAIKCIMNAQTQAKDLGYTEVGTAQLLLGLIAEGVKDSSGGYLGTTIKLPAAVAQVKKARSAPRGGMRPTSEVPFSIGAKRAFEEAVKESQRLSHQYISAEHILLALLEVDEGVSDMIRALGEDPMKLREGALAQLQTELSAEKGTPPDKGANVSAAKAAGKAGKAGQKGEQESMLEEFGTDLTELARKGKIDPVIGRDKEVARCVEILARRRKNNPILLGEPGVGKTAIGAGLAVRIVSGKCPDFLVDKRIVSLDMGLLMAGAKERGELENRVTKLLEEVVGDDDLILMIDEIHTLVGAGAIGRGGGGGGGMDISNMMKPALSRGQMQCVGATTLDEHRKYIEQDAALARRFQPVFVNEPSPDEALEILQGLRKYYEEHHKVSFDDEALKAAVELSSRYIPDRFLPDKAIDLMDEAGSRARIEAFKEKKAAKKAAVAKSQTDLTDSSAVWSELNAECKRREAAAASSQKLGDEVVAQVGAAEIEAVAAAWTKIPLEQLTEDEGARLLTLEDDLTGRVIGQEEAVHAVARSLRRGRTGLASPDRPQGVFLFAGPTGVGKTELTKALCNHMFGTDNHMVRLDMSEYMERHTVAKLIGAPPGYAGYGDGGTLTEAVRRNPYTVVLLDEVEKAHPDVFNILLQVFEDGRLTDSTGRVVDFKNTLLIMTSNVGAQAIMKDGAGGLGFEVPDETEEDGGVFKRMRSMVLDALKEYFRPELLNRIDEVVVFKKLTRDNVRMVATYMLNDLGQRLAAKGVVVRVTERAMDSLLNQGYDQAMGARPMRRAIMSMIEDPMCEALLLGEFEVGDTALVDAGEDGAMRITVCGANDGAQHPCYTPEKSLEEIQRLVAELSDVTA